MCGSLSTLALVLILQIGFTNAIVIRSKGSTPKSLLFYPEEKPPSQNLKKENKERNIPVAIRKPVIIEDAAIKNVTKSFPTSDPESQPSKPKRFSSTLTSKKPEDDDVLKSSSYYLPLRRPVVLLPEDKLTDAVTTLDRYLSPLLNGGGYNLPFHPPVNPLLALVLSRYGKYVTGTRDLQLYSYMAVNNIHNNKPFGRYKYTYRDQE